MKVPTSGASSTQVLRMFDDSPQEVPPILAMLAHEERGDHGDPRFDALRSLWRVRSIQ